MADQRLIDYIRDNIRRGYSVEYLMQILADQGWDVNEINEAAGAAQGYALPPAPPSSAQAAQAPQQAGAPQPKGGEHKRPRGVTIICILGFLGSALMLVAGLLIILLGQLMAGMLSVGPSFLPDVGGVLGLMTTYMGFIFILLAVVNLAGYLFLWKMKKIGWLIVTLTGIITVVIYAINFSMNYAALIALFIVIIAYLFVKRKLFV